MLQGIAAIEIPLESKEVVQTTVHCRATYQPRCINNKIQTKLLC